MRLLNSKRLLSKIKMQANKSLKMSEPLISILIPTYNRLDLLKQALNSALSQTYENIEIFISDNASTDGTLEYLSNLSDSRVRTKSHECNIGLINNWNYCLNQSKGNYYLMLSDDDILKSDAINNLYLLFSEFKNFNKKSEEIAFAYSSCQINSVSTKLTNELIDVPRYETAINFKLGHLEGKRICLPSATMIRTSDAKKVGGYSDLFPAAIDTGLLFRLLSIRPFAAYTPKVTINYMVHQGNFTSNLSLEDLYKTYLNLSQLTYIKNISSDDNQSIIKKRDVKLSVARVIAYAISERNINGRDSNKTSISNIYRYRSLFTSLDGLIILSKSIIKILISYRR